MAKKKKRKDKRKYRYTTGGRVDMRTGGRVKAQVGGIQEKPQKPISTPDEKPVTGGPVGEGVPFDPPNENGDKKDSPNDPPQTPPVQGEGQAFNAGRGTISSEARRERIARTEAETEARAAGQVPEAAVIDPVSQEAGTAVDEDIKQGTTTMAEPTTVTGTTAEQVTPETVTEGQVTEAKTPAEREAASFRADKITEDPEIKEAIGTLSDESLAKVEELKNITDPLDFAEITKKVADGAKAEDVDGVLSSGAFVEVGGVTAAEVNVSETPDAEAKTREAITGEPAPDGVAQLITDSVGYKAKEQRAVKGTAAKGAAAEMIVAAAQIPEDIAAAIVEDPASVEVKVDTEPVEVQAAIAALPPEALVSSQMESLLGGMEDGNIPAWAKPAVAAVNQGLAARGLSASTVARDSLFNAIIQSALPIASSNATALQARAAQNLNNQQQANLQQATQEQQLRMQNLSNRQTAASQTAQMSQQMKVLQSEFAQQAVMTSAQQQQQTRMADLQNQQQKAVIDAQNQQQTNDGYC